MRQALPVQASSAEHPERHIPAADAGWWSLSRLDSALVSTTDGTGVSWHRRDRGWALRSSWSLILPLLTAFVPLLC